MLDAHPGIAMARPGNPEPKVFMRDEIVQRGADWYRATYFAHATPGQLLGEKSTSYLEDRAAAARAAAVLGRAEIVAQLRDPIDRAISNWRFSTENGLEDRPLVRALEENVDGSRDWEPATTSVSPYAYLERGRYLDGLEPWFVSFPDSVHVTFLDDAVTQPSSIGAVYAAVGVDPHHRPRGLRQAVNTSGGTSPSIGPDLHSRLRDYFRDHDERLQERLRRTLPWAVGATPTRSGR